MATKKRHKRQKGSAKRQHRYASALAGCIVVAFFLCRTLDLSLGTKTEMGEAVNNLPSKSIPAAVVEGGEYGCGLLNNETKSRAHWVPYDDNDMQSMNRVKSCLRRQLNHLKEEVDVLTLYKLVCSSNNNNLQSSAIDGVVWQPHSVLAYYDRLHFIGDSVLNQQYLALICLLNPTFVFKDKYAFHKSYTHSFEHGKTTTFILDTIGFVFNNDQRGYFEKEYPHAIAEYTQQDAIILNAGVHYNTGVEHIMHRAVRQIAKQAHHTNATVFLMEPHNTEWPTQNGDFTHSCLSKCQCAPVDQPRIQGHGYLSNITDYNHMNDHRKPDVMTFVQVYPNLPQEQWDKNLQPNHQQSCIPSCLPASWRVDLTRTSLLQENNTALILVPVFWQLISFGMQTHKFTSRHPLDCTHKNAMGILFMNSQLLRSLHKTQEKGK